jgi:hypothetical protein
MFQLELLDCLVVVVVVVMMMMMMIPRTDEFLSFPFNWHMKNVHK